MHDHTPEQSSPSGGLRSLSRRLARPSRLALSSLAIATLVVAACSELPTVPLAEEKPSLPSPAAPVSASGFADDASFGALNSPNSGSWEGSSPDPWDGGVAPAFLGRFPLPTIITIKTSGKVCQVPGILPGYNLCWGPEGTSDHQMAIGLLVHHPGAGSGVWFTSGTEPQTVSIRDEAWAFRAALNDPQPWGDYHWSCGRLAGMIPCWGFEGPSHLEFQRIPVPLTLVSSASGPVAEGTIVSFTAGAEQVVIAGRTVDFSMLQWRWVPDAGADSVTCTWVSGSSCGHTVRGPGTMFASAYVNGEHQQKSVHLDVPPGVDSTNKLTLNGDVKRVPAAGGPVTFVASPRNPTPNWGVTGWLFLPDSGPARSSAGCPRESSARTCTDTITQSGTMRVYGYVPTVNPDSADYHVYVGDDGKLKVSGPAAYDPAGAPVTFTASAPGATSFSVTSWAFHSSDEGLAVRRTPDDTLLRTATVAPARAMTSLGIPSDAGARPAPSGKPGRRVTRKTIAAGALSAPASVAADCVGERCSFVPPGAGYVVATAVVDGESQTDSTFTAPEIVHMRVEASAETVDAGTEVTFTASAEKASAFLEITEWRFVADSAATPAIACAGSIGLSCVEAISRSGAMWAFGTVNGRADSGFATVSVRITPPDDSTGGDGCDEGLRLRTDASSQSVVSGVAALATVDCSPPDPDSDDLVLTCVLEGSSSRTMVRGERVECTARLRSGSAFEMSASRTVTGDVENRSPRPINFSTSDSRTYRSSGIAATSTVVSVNARRSGTRATFQRSVGFSVQPRATTPIMLTQPRPQVASRGELSTEVPPNGGIVFGQYRVSRYANTGELPVRLATEGPNAGLAFLAALPDTAPGGVTLVNSALTGAGGWARDQADFASHTNQSPKPYYSPRWCRPTDYPRMIGVVNIHEGSQGSGLSPAPGHPERPGTSHYDIRRRAIAEHLAPRLEALVFSQTDAARSGEVWDLVNRIFARVTQDMSWPIDRQFDNIEHQQPLLYSDIRLGCQDYLYWKGGNR